MNVKVFFTSIMILLFFISISSSIFIAISNHSITTQETSSKVIYKFHMVKIIIPLGSDVIPNHYTRDWGISLQRLHLDVGGGTALFCKLTVKPGPITIQPLIYDPIILNTGDNISLIFGTYHYYHYYPPQSEEKRLLIGRFYGVTVEKYI